MIALNMVEVVPERPLSRQPSGLATRAEWQLVFGTYFIARRAQSPRSGPPSSLSLPLLYLFPIGPSRRPSQPQALPQSGVSFELRGMSYPVIDWSVRQ